MYTFNKKNVFVYSEKNIKLSKEKTYNTQDFLCNQHKSGCLNHPVDDFISAYLLLWSVLMALALDKYEVIQFGPACDTKGLRAAMLHLIWEDLTGGELIFED